MIDRDDDTLRPPPPDTLEGMTETMAELRAALERVGELAGNLLSRLTLTQLAVLTAEHRVNVLTERSKDHETRLQALEGLRTDPPMAAE